MEETTKKPTALRDKLIDGILESIPDSRLNGHPTNCLPGNCNISFSYIEGESLLLLLDALGIAASSGSACTSGSLHPSHVLMAIGLPYEIAHGSLRLTIDRENTEEQVGFILETARSGTAGERYVSRLSRQKGLIEENQTFTLDIHINWNTKEEL
ncbi:MAG: aminotransferase class V-fold PLP-dependent enzyme [Anaerotignum faecicola]